MSRYTLHLATLNRFKQLMINSLVIKTVWNYPITELLRNYQQ